MQSVCLSVCLRRLWPPLCTHGAAVGCSLSARSWSVCGLERASWRCLHSPVTDGCRLTHSRLCAPGLRLFTHGEHARGSGHVHRGHERTWTYHRPLVTHLTRGLCSGKRPEAKESEADRSEDCQSVPGHGLFKFKQLYENPWTVPNFLCVCRIALAPLLGHLIITQHFHLSLALFTLAGATDLLDGYIARTWPNQKSALGSALDPLADKILISVLYVSLTYAELIPVLLTALVISRDIGLIAAVFWVRYKTVPPPVTLSKFFNPCYTTAQLKPTLFSKVNTVIQLLLVAASLAAPVLQYTDSVLLQCLWLVTAVTTTASGYSYWHIGRKTVQVLNSNTPRSP